MLEQPKRRDQVHCGLQQREPHREGDQQAQEGVLSERCQLIIGHECELCVFGQNHPDLRQSPRPAPARPQQRQRAHQPIPGRPPPPLLHLRKPHDGDEQVQLIA